MAHDETVTVRMYRRILGDCFLVTHRMAGERPYHALIDCGVLQCIGATKPFTKQAVGDMPGLVADLKAHTAGRLDLVIATHEHYDHLSGFLLAFDVFETFKIDRVWMAWTEDPHDDLAGDINAHGKKALRALIEAAKAQPFHMAGDLEAERRRSAIDNLLQFYWDEDGFSGETGLAVAAKRAPGAGKAPRSCKAVLNWLKSKPDDPNLVEYLRPGQIVRFGINERLTAHVLGPPRDGARLLQMNPSKGDGKEVYLTSRDDVAAVQATLRLQAKKPKDAERLGSMEDYPFSARFDRDPAAVAAGDCDVAKRYYADNDSDRYRRIDAEWMGSVEALAMKIDGDVNNTSLALAIAVPDGDILLFPADAQVGNWLSWHEQTYPKEPANKDEPVVTASDLLARTVLYKVGHHGSHNATLQAQGLELMTHPDLVALIPVVEAVAREQSSSSNPDGWAMPYDPLYSRLKTRTRSRILRGDGEPKVEAAAFADAPQRFDLSYADKTKVPLWVELTLAVKAP